MSSFAPINDDHAVTGVLFGLQLDEFIEPATIDAIRRSNRWVNDLPAVTTLPPVEINQGGYGYPMPGVQFAIVRPDSRPLWSLKFSGYEIIVECTAYSRWAEVWKTASAYIEQAFEIVRSKQTDLNIVDFRLQVTDQFRALSDSYEVRDLFNEGTRYLSPLIFDGRQLWNNAVGWFEEDSDIHFADTLAVQVQGHGEGTKVGAPYVVTVQHFSRAVTAGDARPEIDRLDAIIWSQHLRNKAVIAELLSEGMRDRIGLRP